MDIGSIMVADESFVFTFCLWDCPKSCISNHSGRPSNISFIGHSFRLNSSVSIRLPNDKSVTIVIHSSMEPLMRAFHEAIYFNEKCSELYK